MPPVSDKAATSAGRARRGLLPAHRSSANVAGATYGLILAASVIGAAGAKPGAAAGYVDAYLVVTLLVFYLAHVYSEILARWIRDRHVPAWQGVRAELRAEWPMVAAPLLPIGILSLGVLDAVDDRVAINVALGACLVQLTAGITYAARRGGANRRQTILSVLVGLSFGIVIVALKMLVK